MAKTINPAAMAMGWVAGMAVQRMREPVEPYCYDYNGVWFVDIDSIYTDELKAEYPYALLYFASLGYYELVVSKTPWYGTGEPYMHTDIINGGETQFGEKITNTSQRLYFANQHLASLSEKKQDWETEWYEAYMRNELGLSPYDDNGEPAFGGEYLAFWANHNVMSADGKTVLIPKTEPVPVYV